jgi:hypothetical protein
MSAGQATGTPAGARERRIVAPERPRSYYGRPILKEPVWTWEIPTYFFAGGLGGGAAVLAALADATGRPALARRAWPLSLAALAVSPALLISDLGRPERFVNMLRVVKPTSPMSVGTWTLTTLGGSAAGATAHSLLGRLPRLGPPSKLVAAALGPWVATYTAVLVADTAIPVWHEARRELPFVFAGGALASAGAALTLTAPRAEAGLPRRAAVAGAALELAATVAMERRLGILARPYRSGPAARFARAARALSAGGAGLLATSRGRHRAQAAGGAALLLAGALSERWAVYRAGFASARDPAQVVEPQRRGA